MKISNRRVVSKVNQRNNFTLKKKRIIQIHVSTSKRAPNSTKIFKKDTNMDASFEATKARRLAEETHPTRRPSRNRKKLNVRAHHRMAMVWSGCAAYSCDVCTWQAWSGVGVPAWRSSPQKMCSWLFHV